MAARRVSPSGRNAIRIVELLTNYSLVGVTALLTLTVPGVKPTDLVSACITEDAVAGDISIMWGRYAGVDTVEVCLYHPSGALTSGSGLPVYVTLVSAE